MFERCLIPICKKLGEAEAYVVHPPQQIQQKNADVRNYLFLDEVLYAFIRMGGQITREKPTHFI